MNEREINQNKDTSYQKKKNRKINKWGVYISLILIIIGLVWYGVNVGLIPFTVIQEQAGPIILVLIGLLILIRSLQTKPNKKIFFYFIFQINQLDKEILQKYDYIQIEVLYFNKIQRLNHERFTEKTFQHPRNIRV